MPYILFKKDGKYCTKNIRTGNITCYKDESTREKMIRIKESYSHGWGGPTKVKQHARKGRVVRSHWRKR